MLNRASRLGYTTGLQGRIIPYERPLPTGAENFQSLIGEDGGYSAVGRLPEKASPGKGRRKAGEGLELYLRRVFGTGKVALLPPMRRGGVPQLADPREIV